MIRCYGPDSTLCPFLNTSSDRCSSWESFEVMACWALNIDPSNAALRYDTSSYRKISDLSYRLSQSYYERQTLCPPTGRRLTVQTCDEADDPLVDRFQCRGDQEHGEDEQGRPPEHLP